MPLSNEAIQGLLAFGAGTLANNTGNYGMFGPAVGKGGLLGLQQYGNAQQNSLLTRRQEQDERFRTFQMEDANIARKLQFQKMQEDAENQKRVNEMLMRILGGGPQAQPGPQVAPPQFSPNSVQDALVMGGGPTRKADAILQGSAPANQLTAPPVAPEGQRMVDPNVLAQGGLAMAGLDPRIAQTLLSGANFYQGAQQADVAAQERQLTADRGRLTPVSGMPGVFVNNDNEKFYKWVRTPEGLKEQELTTDELEAMDLRGKKAGASSVSVNTMNPEQAAKTELLNQGISDMVEFKQMVMPNGKVNRAMVAGLNAPGFAGVPGTDSRTAYSLIYNAVEAKLRAESGAAVPDAEVKRMAARFIPSIMDSDATIKSKVERMEAFLRGSFSRIKGAGVSTDDAKRTAPPTNNDALKDPLGIR